jgi:hypothetical protein
MAKTVVNNLQVVPPGADKQIVLRVTFAEIDRNVANSFGVARRGDREAGLDNVDSQHLELFGE